MKLWLREHRDSADRQSKPTKEKDLRIAVNNYLENKYIKYTYDSGNQIANETDLPFFIHWFYLSGLRWPKKPPPSMWFYPRAYCYSFLFALPLLFFGLLIYLLCALFLCYICLKCHHSAIEEFQRFGRFLPEESKHKTELSMLDRYRKRSIKNLRSWMKETARSENDVFALRMQWANSSSEQADSTYTTNQSPFLVKDVLSILREDHSDHFRQVVDEMLPETITDLSERHAIIDDFAEDYEELYLLLTANLISFERLGMGSTEKRIDAVQKHMRRRILDGLYSSARFSEDGAALVGVGTPVERPAGYNDAFRMPEVARDALLELPDRFTHQYIIGKTGSGKTSLLRNQIIQDMHAGHGVVLMSPEAGLMDDALRYLPEHRQDDLVYIDFSPAAIADRSHVIGFNPFANVSPEDLTQYVSELEQCFLRAVGDMGVKMGPLFNNTIYALCQLEGATLHDFDRLLDPDDTSLRRHVVGNQSIDPRTRTFFERYDKKPFYSNVYDNIIARIDFLLRDPVSTVLSTPTLNLEELLNQKKSIVLFNLSKLRSKQAEVVGQIILSTVQNIFFRRDDIPEDDRLPYIFTMDEFQTYATSNEDALRDLLTRVRKYKVGVVMAHQNIKDIPTNLSASIFGNVGTMVGMNMSSSDAKVFTTEAQLQNFDDWTDERGSRAHIQLQNLQPGQAAVMTPQERKAFFVQVPYTLEGIEQNPDIEAIKDASRQQRGIPAHDPIAARPEMKEATDTPPKQKPSRKKDTTIDEDEDDFFIDIS